VLIARDGQPVFERSVGQADRARGVANTPATRFNIGSINKIFTRLAIGQLIAGSRLKLTDTLGSVLPDYPNAEARGATIEQLLTHQGGIADFFGPRFAATPKDQFRSNADYFRFVAPQPLVFPPGTRRQYCNGCYVVLGEIVATLAGTTYEQYVIDHILTPAGMRSTGFARADRLPGSVARGYTRQAAPDGPAASGTERDNGDMHGAAGSAAGGAYATAADLLRFDNALREGRLASRDTTAWVVGSAPAAAGQRAGGVGIAGGAPGLNATLESEGRWTVVVLANLDPPAAERLGVALHRQLSR
jgi:CubicO group peptidase (beta-lactamase class C family)